MIYATEMARVTGLEPATSGVTGRRSNQLSYTRNSEARRVRGGRRFVKRPALQFDQIVQSFRPNRFASIGNGQHQEWPASGMGGDGIEPPTLSV